MASCWPRTSRCRLSKCRAHQHCGAEGAEDAKRVAGMLSQFEFASWTTDGMLLTKTISVGIVNICGRRKWVH
jgi:hypothetical protein